MQPTRWHVHYVFESTWRWPSMTELSDDLHMDIAWAAFSKCPSSFSRSASLQHNMPSLQHRAVTL